MNKLLLNIPHSSKELTSDFWENVVADKQVVLNFLNDITDVKTDELFGSNNYHKIVVPFSRLLCDVEKFLDDDLEPMSKFGMGVVYSKTNHGEVFKKYDSNYKNKIVDKYYLPYHNNLNNVCKNLLTHKLILIDCHSFCDSIIMDKSKLNDLPDICIGFNDIYSSSYLNDFVVNYFRGLGYSVKENYPYSGSMVPNDFLENKVDNFYSIMIEVNKKVYLTQNGFSKLQQQINDLFTKLETLNLE